MTPFDPLRHIAEIEFADIVVQTDLLGVKMRLHLIDASYIDVWVSRELAGRYGFHWERRHIDGRIFRYDNFPDTNWSNLDTFPFHFHDGSQGHVLASPFAAQLEPGFRQFLEFARHLMAQTN